MAGEKSEQLGNILLNRGIITSEQLTEALTAQKGTKRRLGEILVELKYLDEHQLMSVLSQVYNLPVFDVATVHVDQQILKLFSLGFLTKNCVLPVAVENSHLVVAMNDPLDLQLLQRLKNLTGMRIRPVLASSREIRTYLEAISPMFSAAEAIKEVEFHSDKAEPEKKELSAKELEIAAQEAPLVRLVSSIIAEAIKNNASDIHFEPQREHMRVRERIDGVLYEKMTIPRDLQPAVISRIKIISGIDIAEARRPQDGRMSVSGCNREYDVRVSTLPDIFGEKVVLRLLDKRSVVLSLDSLGMYPEERELLTGFAARPHGMVLVTGPTGSGKTTTLYSILNVLNQTTKNIVTVEDPVEYELPGINQTTINTRAGYTFATAIRHILRQDPDIIMIGEIRDLETAEIAIQAALTGHLVLSTIHTNSAPGVITRLIDMSVEPFLVSSAVIGVAAQRLVRKLCPACKREYALSEEMRRTIPELANVPVGSMLAAPVGCAKCNKLGYTGRTAVFEMFGMDEDVRGHILRKSNETMIKQTLTEKGMKTLRQSGFRKALDQVTSVEEVMRITYAEQV